MKLLTIFGIFLLSAFAACEECGEGATWVTEGWPRQFSCSENGITVSFDVPGCSCTENFDLWYNKNEKKCTEVKCANMDCAGKPNQAFFMHQSGSRNSCECNMFVTRDAVTGCMCKNGFCKNHGSDECVKRDCVHPVFD